VNTEEIYTDVLVIGGGAAGLIAALEAKRGGLDSSIISKSKVGRSGNTIISGAGMAVLIPGPDSEDSLELFYNDIVRSGNEINDKELVNVFIKGSTEIIGKLTEYGVMLKRTNNHLLKKRAPGHSVQRSIYSDISKFPYLIRGLSISLPLLNKVKRCGIRIIENAPIIKLLTSDDRVCGALAIDKKSGNVLVFRTSAIILASGGCGRIFSKSNNTADITGDSYSLAYDAGALLRDMEFVQFYPTMMYSPIKTSISNALFGHGAVLRNRNGERFMENYDRSGDMATRDVMTRAVYTEITDGRGDNGCVFMDCRSIPEDILETGYAELCKTLRRKGIDPAQHLIHVSPTTHFFMGGLVINSKGETTLPGLLACGESVGGLHGANRLAGDALSETVIFGIVAGRSAMEAVKAVKAQFIPPFSCLEIESFRKGSISLTELRATLRECMWKYSSIVRNQDSLERARKEINEISNHIEDAEINDVKELVSFYELKHMIRTSGLIIEGAFSRRESRGAHYRKDYPDSDAKNFKGSYFLKSVNGKLDIQFRSL
jgi:succinate dehydrogenase/fumarate reductase flavoprotein subunit